MDTDLSWLLGFYDKRLVYNGFVHWIPTWIEVIGCWSTAELFLVAGQTVQLPLFFVE